MGSLFPNLPSAMNSLPIFPPEHDSSPVPCKEGLPASARSLAPRLRGLANASQAGAAVARGGFFGLGHLLVSLGGLFFSLSELSLTGLESLFGV